MSSTGRGGERLADDFYGTPAWCVDALLDAGVILARHLGRSRILEPSAGSGAILEALLARGAQRNLITTVEQHEGRAAALANVAGRVVHADFLKVAVGRFDLVIMNPPYNEAQAHVERAIDHVAPGGVCAALLRIGFAASKKRRAVRAAHHFDVYLLASRPRFAGKDQGTDSCEYAWFVFGDGRGGKFQMLEAPEMKRGQQGLFA